MKGIQNNCVFYEAFEYNSDDIFLQPIDQQYVRHNKTTQKQYEHESFFKEYQQNTMKFLDLSTDDETEFSRQNSFNNEDSFSVTEKMSSLLKKEWRRNIQNLYFKNRLMMTNAVISQRNLNTRDFTPASPQNIKKFKSSQSLPTSSKSQFAEIGLSRHHSDELKLVVSNKDFFNVSLNTGFQGANKKNNKKSKNYDY
jgi:hypothetical protein